MWVVFGELGENFFLDKFLESFWRKNFFMGGENFKFGEICHFEWSALAQSEKSILCFFERGLFLESWEKKFFLSVGFYG